MSVATAVLAKMTSFHVAKIADEFYLNTEHQTCMS